MEKKEKSVMIYVVSWLEEGDTNTADAKPFADLEKAKKYMQDQYKEWLHEDELVYSNVEEEHIFAYTDNDCISISITKHIVMVEL